MSNVVDIRNETPRSNKKRALTAIKNIVRHHSATTDGDWKAFWNYWNKSLGWGTGGYHEIILRDGTVQLCYDADEITNGVAKNNTSTYHICLVGNGSFTQAQEKAWEERALYNMERFKLATGHVLGHKEIKGTSTACPGVDMGTVRARLVFLTMKKETPVLYKVQVGAFGEKDNAVALAKKLQKDGYPCYITTD